MSTSLALRRPARWWARARSAVDPATRLESLPLRVRLLALLVVLMLAALALTTAFTSVVLRRQLLANTDRELSVAAAPVATTALEELQNGSAERIPTDYAVIVMPAATRRQTLVPTALRTKAHPVIFWLPAEDPRVRRHIPFNVPSSDGGNAWRVVAYSLTQDAGTVAVALSLDHLDDTVERLVTLETLIGLTIIGAFAVIGWYAVRRAFGPLAQIEDTAAAIAAGDLTRRVPEPSAQDEVSSLSRSLNAMLAQIESSFAVREASEQRMREFVADASHELRTPLAAVRGYAELYRQGAVRDPDAVTGAMRRIEDEATRMSGLVEDLLLLTRLDRRPALHRTEVDLTVLAADAAQDARAIAPDRSIRVVGRGGPLRPVLVDGDDGQLRQVLANLVGNALNHTPAGTAVEIAVGIQQEGPSTAGGESAGPTAILEVRDHGLGVDPVSARKVFERFFRADPSRARGTGGNGLGLAIVAAIVAAHAGKVGVAPTLGGGATFVVELPAAPVQPTSS